MVIARSQGEPLSNPLPTPAATSSDSDSSESLQPWLERVQVSMLLLALLATFMRVYSRRLNNQPLWWDDWLACGNMCWFIVTLGFIAADIGLGVGLHMTTVPVANYIPMIMVTLAVDILYLWSLVWSKLSLLTMYYRVFRFGYFQHACCGVAALVVAWAIVSTFLLFFLCKPFSKYWDSSVQGHCGNPQPVRLFNSIATVVTDVIILCLPLPQIWRLHGLRKWDKVGLTALFVLGFLVVSVASARIVVQENDESKDKSYSIAPDAGWLMIEMTASIMSASFPAMSPAVIEAWRHARHAVNACRGRAAHGRAARMRQQNGGGGGGGELGSTAEDSDLSRGGPPQHHHHHPDDVDGSFHRLYSKNGSAVTCVPENEQSHPSTETADREEESSCLRVPARGGDGHSEQFRLDAIRV